MHFLSALLILAFLGHASGQAPLPGFRPASVPLLVIDPFVNVWSMGYHLMDDCTKYWDNTNKTLFGIIRVDANVYRFMGSASNEFPLDDVTQKNVTVWPTRSIYVLQDPEERVQLTLQFTTPLLPMEWDLSSKPVSYITFNVTSIDKSMHSVQLYFDITGEIAVNSVEQEVDWRRFEIGDDVTSSVMEIGTVSQQYFDIAGDDVGIDWGYAYIAVNQDEYVSTVIYGAEEARTQFVDHGSLPSNDDTDKPRKVNDDWPVLAVSWDFLVDSSGSVVKFLAFAYDDHYSIKYFGKLLQPYWRRPAAQSSIDVLLLNAMTDYQDLLEACNTFDLDLYRRLEAVGGSEYATLAVLAYRQAMAATKLVWNEELQMPWAFIKEIGSGGSLSSIDIIAAISPLILYQDPAYLELLLLPLLAYANNETDYASYNYTNGWAPHNLGSYPIASITTEQQENMPMEETGNILTLLAASTKLLGIRLLDLWYPRYWPLLQRWADYLVDSLPDPDYQLSADSFQGGSSHNANLALKGIIGLGAFGQLCRTVGRNSDADHYSEKAEEFAAQWLNLADDGDHYRLQYDLNGTWSQKYNLLYERLLGLNILPPSVATQEVFYYLNNTLNEYGIPLDNRANYSRLAWTSYVAAMATDTTTPTEIFGTLYNWVNNSNVMSPLPDWYDTVSGEKLGYVNSPAVGALFACALLNSTAT